MPAPVGGIKAIYQNIVYPEIAKSNGIKGKVYLLLYINENGGLDDIKVIKGIGGGCNEAAIAGVKAAKFTPVSGAESIPPLN
jgi:protein TonB